MDITFRSGFIFDCIWNVFISSYNAVISCKLHRGAPQIISHYAIQRNGKSDIKHNHFFHLLIPTKIGKRYALAIVCSSFSCHFQFILPISSIMMS